MGGKTGAKKRQGRDKEVRKRCRWADPELFLTVTLHVRQDLTCSLSPYRLIAEGMCLSDEPVKIFLFPERWGADI